MFNITATQNSDIITKVIDKSDNNIILFVIAFTICISLLAIPFYRLAQKSKKEQMVIAMDEKKMLMDVVKENTAAITTLTSTLETNNNIVLKMLDSIDDRSQDTINRVENIDVQQEHLVKSIDTLLGQNDEYHEILNDLRSYISEAKVILHRVDARTEVWIDDIKTKTDK